MTGLTQIFHGFLTQIVINLYAFASVHFTTEPLHLFIYDANYNFLQPALPLTSKPPLSKMQTGKHLWEMFNLRKGLFKASREVSNTALFVCCKSDRNKLLRRYPSVAQTLMYTSLF